MLTKKLFKEGKSPVYTSRNWSDLVKNILILEEKNKGDVVLVLIFPVVKENWREKLPGGKHSSSLIMNQLFPRVGSELWIRNDFFRIYPDPDPSIQLISDPYPDPVLDPA